MKTKRGGERKVKKLFSILFALVLALSLSLATVAPVVVSADDGPAEASVVTKKVTLIAYVANTGASERSYDVVLKINGVQKEVKSISIPAGGSQYVTFDVTELETDSYTIDVEEIPVVDWSLVGSIIAGVVVVGLFIFFMGRRGARKLRIR